MLHVAYSKTGESAACSMSTLQLRSPHAVVHLLKPDPPFTFQPFLLVTPPACWASHDRRRRRPKKPKRPPRKQQRSRRKAHGAVGRSGAPALDRHHDQDQRPAHPSLLMMIHMGSRQYMQVAARLRGGRQRGLGLTAGRWQQQQQQVSMAQDTGARDRGRQLEGAGQMHGVVLHLAGKGSRSGSMVGGSSTEGGSSTQRGTVGGTGSGSQTGGMNGTGGMSETGIVWSAETGIRTGSGRGRGTGDQTWAGTKTCILVMGRTGEVRSGTGSTLVTGGTGHGLGRHMGAAVQRGVVRAVLGMTHRDTPCSTGSTANAPMC